MARVDDVEVFTQLEAGPILPEEGVDPLRPTINAQNRDNLAVDPPPCFRWQTEVTAQQALRAGREGEDTIRDGGWRGVAVRTVVGFSIMPPA